ncbi:MAG TPA: PfkB family carbohydrate kinase [Micromonosporaceae bacterium]|nr:PfkB family carbohydrate kinase [Micromonosporaceae bacterium]
MTVPSRGDAVPSRGVAGPSALTDSDAILVVGDVVTDVLAVLRGPLAVGSDTPAEVRFTGGGSAANTAAWLAAAGAPVTLVATVGADPAGDARLAELAAAGVRLAVRRCPDAPTGTVVVLAEPHERSMLNDRGANLLLAPSDVDNVLAGARHLHLSGYPVLDARSRPAGWHALAAARALNITTSVDAASADPLRRVGGPAFLSWVRGTNMLLANVDEAQALTGSGAGPAELATELLDAAEVAVVKAGSGGAVWADRSGRVIAVPAEPVTVVDPTGAGDAFAAGLLAAWLAGADPQSALRAGVAMGTRAVGAVGARPRA